MSSFISRQVNPKTNKEQDCFAIDDFYGSHQYGYCFPKDGQDANWDMFDAKFSYRDKCDCFSREDMEINKRARNSMRLKDCN